jgi:hypothetical protein
MRKNKKKRLGLRIYKVWVGWFPIAARHLGKIGVIGVTKRFTFAQVGNLPREEGSADTCTNYNGLGL